ncbi:MAG: hypothetical protein EOP47_03505 [Sphingobacteriaceae bacterium]|nr:MAG: hypothetical protein EOP47_03505 [Sphingobacteriaceae bacterium]
MKIKQFVLGAVLALSCMAISAKAQKTYTEGTVNYTIGSVIGPLDAKIIFNADSNAFITQQGPANIKAVENTKGDYVAVMVDVPIISMKKAAVLTADEIKQAEASEPKYTFTTTTEAKQINGFNSKKVIAKDAKGGPSIEIWVTNDIKAPANNLTKLFEGAGGYPVQFKTTQNGQNIDVTLKSIVQEKIPAGSFGIPAGYDRITLKELNSLGGQQ